MELNNDKVLGETKEETTTTTLSPSPDHQFITTYVRNYVYVRSKSIGLDSC
jgi:hypothetical protein